MNGPSSAPFHVFSIHFDHEPRTGPSDTPDGESAPWQPERAIAMKDPGTDAFLAAEPEWTLEGRRLPAAYVQRAQPTVLVVFQKQGAVENGTYHVAARSVDGPYDLEAVNPKTLQPLTSVELVFDPSTGCTQPIPFRFTAALPDAIGPVHIEWEWNAGAERVAPIGTTQHHVYTTLEPPIEARVWLNLRPQAVDDQTRGRWTYRPLMEWTCDWAAGERAAKAICDSIIANIKSTGLKYGLLKGDRWSVRGVLNGGGGLCGGFNKLFQALAGCQGVLVERRTLWVDERNPDGEKQLWWNGIVVTNPGLNQKQPTWPCRRYQDLEFVNDNWAAGKRTIDLVTEPRYVFNGALNNYHNDGHSINFFVDGEDVYLYDLCFRDAPVRVNLCLPDGMKLPPSDFSNPFEPGKIPAAVGVNQLGDFKEQYLNGSVMYMLGSLVFDGRLYTAGISGNDQQGLTVPTDQITYVDGKPTYQPDADDKRQITFYWNNH